MIIQLADFISSNEQDKVVTGSLTMEEVALIDATYPVRKAEDFPIYIIKEGKNSITVSFHTEVVLGIACGRCLEEVLTPISMDVHEEIDFDKMEEISQDEYPYLDDKDLDLDQLIFESLVPLIPTKVVCKEDCKGLCPVCGTNLNDQECGCDRTVADPRMAAIQDIFKNFKEV